jgi:hypothetical protein
MEKIMNNGKKRIVGLNILIVTMFGMLMQFQDGSDLVSYHDTMAWIVLALFAVSAAIGAVMVVPVDVIWMFGRLGRLILSAYDRPITPYGGNW